jgi:hypothetical protein
MHMWFDAQLDQKILRVSNTYFIFDFANCPIFSWPVVSSVGSFQIGARLGILTSGNPKCILFLNFSTTSKRYSSISLCTLFGLDSKKV